MCYALRRAVLRTGNTYTFPKYFRKTDFYFPGRDGKEGDGSMNFLGGDNGGQNQALYWLDIRQFCLNVCEAARKFYDSKSNKATFTRYALSIHADVEAGVKSKKRGRKF